MIRISQHARLARPVSTRLARRNVFVSSRHSPSILTAASRTFSSSRPYATALASSEGAPSTSSLPPDRISSRSSSAGSSSSGNLTVLVRPPSPEAIEPDEEPLENIEARFQISTRAAEQLRSIAQRESNPNVALRVAVESGGCHGYQYKMDLTDVIEGDGDYHFSVPTIAPSNILIDPVSLSLLSGSTLDFATELIGSTFRITDNPHAAGGCGCGVSWEAKI